MLIGGVVVGVLLGCLTPCGVCIPCGAFLGALVGGLEALAAPFSVSCSALALPCGILATSCSALALPFGILATSCGEVVQGMCMGLGDMMHGFCGTLAI